MRHLSPDELLDLAEGTRADASAGHLTQCAACREQLADLRATLALAMTADVPEPSPLFWDHLSARVRRSVAAEDMPGRPSIFRLGFRRWSWQSLAAAGTAVAGIVVVAMTVTMRTLPGTGGNAGLVPQPSSASSASTLGDPAVASAASDASLALLADVADDLDWDSVANAGMTMGVGAADGAVFELTDAERAELQRLLQEAMAGA
jgi:hypothetical protein